MVTQPVVLQKRFHGVGRPTDITGIHGLRIVQLLLTPACLMAVGSISSLGCSSAAFQQHVLQIGLFGSRHRCSFNASCTSIATAPSSSSLRGLRQPIGRPVLTAATPCAAPVASDVATIEDAVLLPQVSLQQGDGVESFAAEATRELLAVCGDVALQLHLCSKRLSTEDALPGLESCETEVRLRYADSS